MTTTEPSRTRTAAPTRKEDIVNAARELYEEKGLSKTSVLDITTRVGVTRSLFYHYFPDKEAVTSAVLDDYIADYMEAMELWNENRQTGNIEHALSGVIKVMRMGIFEHDSFRRSLTSRENAALYLEFVNRVTDRLAHFVIENTVPDYAKLHPVRIEHLYETFYILILGMIGYTRQFPDVDDDILKDVIAQTLHMDRGTALPCPRTEHEN